MPECPHEYIVRGKTAGDDVYAAMFRTIDADGEYGEWGGDMFKYMHPGDGHYYWKMTANIDESIIINRAIEDEQKQKRPALFRKYGGI